MTNIYSILLIVLLAGVGGLLMESVTTGVVMAFILSASAYIAGDLKIPGIGPKS